MATVAGTVGEQLTQARRLAGLLRKYRSSDDRVRLHAGWELLDRFRGHVLPEFRLTDFAKRWFEDEEFFAVYQRFIPVGTHTAERKFFIRELMRLVSHLDGDTAEAGVYTGATSWFICDGRRGLKSTHWAFDSFQGLSAPAGSDGEFWRSGDLTVSPQVARDNLSEFEANVIQGWIPDSFNEASFDRLVFSHIDVDLYEPTRDSIEYFYPATVAGGIIVCDDYGFTTTPGATRAIDEYMADRPEPVLLSPTGQGIIFKR